MLIKGWKFLNTAHLLWLIQATRFYSEPYVCTDDKLCKSSHPFPDSVYKHISYKILLKVDISSQTSIIIFPTLYRSFSNVKHFKILVKVHVQSFNLLEAHLILHQAPWHRISHSQHAILQFILVQGKLCEGAGNFYSKREVFLFHNTVQEAIKSLYSLHLLIYRTYIGA